MSRPDTASAAEPRIPRAERTVHRRSAPVPMRVVAERLTPEEAASGVDAFTAPATGGVATLAEAPLPPPEIVGLPVPADRGLPVLDRRARRRPFARLLALLRGRRAGGCGRHRPDTIPSSGWSMFEPSRRSRRRFGARR